MIQCAYLVLCQNASINATTRQVTAEEFFSTLEMEGPGSTDFHCLVGVWGVQKGKAANLELLITTPNKEAYAAKFKTAESRDENIVYNSIINCSKLPIMEPGIYTFRLFERMGNNKTRELASRPLTVSFAKVGEFDDE
jgi:hypothetical protein